MVEKKYERHEEVLTGMIEQRKAAIDDHTSGRKLLSDEVRLPLEKILAQ